MYTFKKCFVSYIILFQFSKIVAFESENKILPLKTCYCFEVTMATQLMRAMSIHHSVSNKETGRGLGMRLVDGPASWICKNFDLAWKNQEGSDDRLDFCQRGMGTRLAKH